MFGPLGLRVNIQQRNLSGQNHDVFLMWWTRIGVFTRYTVDLDCSIRVPPESHSPTGKYIKNSKTPPKHDRGFWQFRAVYGIIGAILRTASWISHAENFSFSVRSLLSSHVATRCTVFWWFCNCVAIKSLMKVQCSIVYFCMSWVLSLLIEPASYCLKHDVWTPRKHPLPFRVTYPGKRAIHWWEAWLKRFRLKKNIECHESYAFFYVYTVKFVHNMVQNICIRTWKTLHMLYTTPSSIQSCPREYREDSLQTSSMLIGFSHVCFKPNRCLRLDQDRFNLLESEACGTWFTVSSRCTETVWFPRLCR